ncbi:F-box domain [Macleaya cordata]|uniref:F-box domain n=1 Tax=Macleaya cordata TaxID=56857 RepID=A0A200Q7D8_MACCD|nr:F-box domain [Macleaya cordata]
MENLQEEIIFDIFSRLPVESVLKCRQVCKTWNALLHHSYFAHMHLGRCLLQVDDHYSSNAVAASETISKVGFLSLMGPRKKNIAQLYYLEYDGNDELSYKTFRKINHPHIRRPDWDAIVGSCNGLVCLSVDHPRYQFRDPVNIWNPITREYTNIPEFNKADYSGLMTCGFGYAPSTNEYKVVRIYYRLGLHSAGQVQVYTLGSDSGWRNKGEIKYFLADHGPGILENGALHWVEYNNWNIVAFDLGKEEFYLLPSLPCFPPLGDYSFSFRVLGGCLCVVHHGGYDSINIWSLKKKCGEWEKLFSISYQSSKTDDYQPFTLTKSGELLLWNNFRSFYRYNSNTGTLEKLVDLDTDLRFYQAMPHKNSFVSLKALGEKCFRRRRGCNENPFS